MSQWMVLYRKEMLGMTRSYKWLWIPVVFILLGVMNPVTTAYMPQLLEANGIAKEVAAAMPVPAAADIMLKTLSQYNTLGLLILALSFMGIVSGERQSGAAVMIHVKPVSHLSLATAKWASMASLALTAFGIGYLATWYYTDILIGSVPPHLIGQSLLLYALWLLFALSAVLMFSSAMDSQAGAAFLALLALAALSLLPSLLGRFMKWSPGRLTGEAGTLLSTGSMASGAWLPIAAALLLTAALIFCSSLLSKRKAGNTGTK